MDFLGRFVASVVRYFASIFILTVLSGFRGRRRSLGWSTAGGPALPGSIRGLNIWSGAGASVGNVMSTIEIAHLTFRLGPFGVSIWRRRVLKPKDPPA